MHKENPEVHLRQINLLLCHVQCATEDSGHRSALPVICARIKPNHVIQFQDDAMVIFDSKAEQKDQPIPLHISTVLIHLNLYILIVFVNPHGDVFVRLAVLSRPVFAAA